MTVNDATRKLVRERAKYLCEYRTEVGVANELVNAGVSKKDIVLGFQAPYKRPFTEFAAS